MNKAIIFFVLFSVGADIQAADKIKAIFNQWPFTTGEPITVNSSESLELFKGLGYNTYFEWIHVPPLSDWNTSGGYSIKAPARTALINYIAAQKSRMDNLEMEYAPFYNEWGWGIFLPLINERAKAMVYREVDVLGNYYGSNVYKNLDKSHGAGWGNIGFSWSANHDTLTFTYSNSAIGASQLYMKTLDLSSNPPAGDLPNLINNQLYKFQAKIDLSNADLVVGDEITIYFFREHKDGHKPDVQSIPLGKTYHPDYSFMQTDHFTHTITGKESGGLYYIDNSGVAVDAINIDREKWVETKLACGLGTYEYNENFRIDFQLKTNGTGANSIMKIVNMRFAGINPEARIFGQEWETRADYPEIKKNYPLEENREAKAIYDLPGGGQSEIRHHLDIPPENGILRKIKGHFPTNVTDMGTSLIQNTVDPLSPVTDMVIKEMLNVIKEGLGGGEPKYFFINADEVNVFRRGINNSPHSPLNGVYNSVSNGEYFGLMIEKHINRYKEVFGGKNGRIRTTFVLAGDMVLPFGAGYHYYAEYNNDQEALTKISGLQTNSKIAIAIWEYDYSTTPNWWGTPEFALTKTQFVTDVIDIVQNNNLKYIAWYATDGGGASLQRVDPNLDTDEEHIQHEIDMAKKWTEITSLNADNFEGYLYTGWWNILKMNNWNGIYPLAYFGWINPAAADLPPEWKEISATNPYSEPVLNFLDNLTVPAPPPKNNKGKKR